METVDIQRLRVEDDAREQIKYETGMSLINESRKLLDAYECHVKKNNTGLRIDVLLNNLILARNQLKL